MEKLYINYNKIQDAWDIGNFLNKLGLAKTEECFWSQIYIKDGVQIVTCYEEKQMPTPEELWKQEVLDTLGLYANECPTDDDIKYNSNFAIMCDGKILALLPKSAKITDAVETLFSYRKTDKGKNAQLSTISYKSENHSFKKSDRVTLYSITYRAFNNSVIEQRFFTKFSDACRFSADTCGTTPKKHTYKYSNALKILFEQEEIDSYAWKGYIPYYA